LGADRTLENTQRAQHETRTVGMAFLTILEEMSNNRIDTPALSGRIKNEIAEPLVALADKRLPVLIGRLGELQKLIDDAKLGSAKVEESVREADAILLEMQNILDKMLEMATYKELVERLRKLIEQQEGLNKETKQEQIERLKNLIEE
jgi:type I site-specific restriction-modification system R (restriction) subunit